MLRSSNCVLTGKTPMEFSKLNECPLDPGTQRMTQKESPVIPLIIKIYNLHDSLLHRGLLHCQRSGESHSDSGAAVEESNHCGAGPEGCGGSLGYQVL